MNIMSFAAISAASLTMLAATPASAQLMTFDDLIFISGGAYEENGITVTGNGDLTTIATTIEGALHLDNSGSSNASVVTFTTGYPFRPVSFDYTSLGFAGDPYGNMKIYGTGYGNGLFYDFGTFSTDWPSSGTNTYHFIPVFPRGFDTLTIENLGIDRDCMPCGHFAIDNVLFTNIHEVPTPESLPLLAAAVGMIAWGARKRRKAG